MNATAKDEGSPRIYKPKGSWEDIRISVLVLEKATDFIIGLDEEGEIDWATTDALDKKLDRNQSDWGLILNRVSDLQNVPLDHMTAKQTQLYRLRIAEGLCRAMQLDFKNARGHLDGAEAFWLARSREKARLWYLSGSVLAFLVFAVLSAILWGLKTPASSVVGSLAPELVLSCFGGAFGAILSILLRVGNSPLEVSAGRQMHLTEGATRVVVGWGAALIAISALKLHIVLPQVSQAESPQLAGFFICLVAGASERLVPTIVRQVEVAVSKTDLAPSSLPPKASDAKGSDS